MTAPSTMLYVSCGGTQEIVAFAFDEASGTLRRAGAVTLPGAPDPADLAATFKPGLRSTGAPLALHPGGDVLYAVTRAAEPRVVSLRIDPVDGALVMIGDAPGVEGTPYLATDRDGRWLLGAAYHANSGWVSAIEPGGAVTGAPVQRVPGLTTAHCMVVHPANRVAYAAATGVPAVQVFALDEAEPPLRDQRAAPATSPDATPRHLALHPSTRFLYAMNETTSVLDSFALSADGRDLVAIQSVDMRPEELRNEHGVGADLVCSADGRFLYACERKRGTVMVLAIDPPTGRLSPVQTVTVGEIPRSLALSPDGRFLATAVQGDGAVRIDAVAGDGTLHRPVACATGGAPVWVTFVRLPDQGSGSGR